VRWTRRSAWLLCAVVVLAGCESCAHRKEVKVDNDLGAVPAQPRTVVIAYRSWLGSSQTLTASADELLFATGRVQRVGGAMSWFVEPQGQRRFVVVNGVAVKTALAVADLQGLLRAIEERLNDGQPARVGGLLKADLLWVEGTQVHAPGLELPSPDVLGTQWGLETFVASAEDPFADACKRGSEPKSFCNEVGAKYRALKLKSGREEHPDLWFYDKSTTQELVFGGVAVETTEDILAQGVATLALASAAYYAPPASQWDQLHIGEYAQGLLGKIRSTEIQPVEASAPAGSAKSALVESWLNAVRTAADQAQIKVARAVVFDLRADHIRGAILGTKIAPAPVERLPPVRLVDVKQGDTPLEPARQPQGWSVELHVARTPAHTGGSH